MKINLIGVKPPTRRLEGSDATSYKDTRVRKIVCLQMCFFERFPAIKDAGHIQKSSIKGFGGLAECHPRSDSFSHLVFVEMDANRIPESPLVFVIVYEKRCLSRQI